MFYLAKNYTVSIKNAKPAPDQSLHIRKIFTEKLIWTGFGRNIDFQAKKYLRIPVSGKDHPFEVWKDIRGWLCQDSFKLFFLSDLISDQLIQ